MKMFMSQHWCSSHLRIENWQSKFDSSCITSSNDHVELSEWLLLNSVQHQSLVSIAVCAISEISDDILKHFMHFLQLLFNIAIYHISEIFDEIPKYSMPILQLLVIIPNIQ